jgi:rhodanese-related sulfurtransferase
VADGSSAAQQQQEQHRLLLLDVRRHDERALYGTIPGSHHLPGVVWGGGGRAVRRCKCWAFAAAASYPKRMTSPDQPKHMPATTRLRAAEEVAAACALPPADFRRQHHFEPPPGGSPGGRDVVVVHSRAGSRAMWAAQLLHDGGCER